MLEIGWWCLIPTVLSLPSPVDASFHTTPSQTQTVRNIFPVLTSKWTHGTLGQLQSPKLMGIRCQFQARFFCPCFDVQLGTEYCVLFGVSTRVWVWKGFYWDNPNMPMLIFWLRLLVTFLLMSVEFLFQQNRTVSYRNQKHSECSGEFKKKKALMSEMRNHNKLF